MATPIDLSQLPAPTIIEPLDFEEIFEARKARLLELTPAADRAELAETLQLESEPLVILLQESAYRELVLRQRINDAAKGVMIATAQGADLQALAALLDVEKLPDETDAELRRRTVMALEGYSTAGSVGAYEFHALSAHPDVKDVSVTSPAPGRVRLVVLSKSGNGEPGAEVINAVRAAVNGERVRPLTDTVEVRGAQVDEYALRGTLYIEPGPSAQAVKRAAQDAAAAYAESRHRLGAYVALSGFSAALHQSGVRRISLESPAQDLEMSADAAAYMTDMVLNVGVVT
jgi:phage-related baseplate assembly protein